MSVADILQQMAQNAGRAQLVRGAILGNTIADVSQVPGQILNDRERQSVVDEQRRRLAANDAHVTAKDAQDAAKQARDDADAQRKEQERQDRGAIIAAGLDPSNPAQPWKYEPAVLEAMKRGRHDIAKELLDNHEKDMRAAMPKTQAELAADAANPSSPTQAQSVTALDLLKPPKPEPVAKPGTIHDTSKGLVRIGDDNTITPLGVQGYHPPAAASGLSGLYSEIDPKAIAAQIRAGDHPPEIAQYGRPAAAAIASELAKQGPNGEPPFNLMRAQMDSRATQKHIATMNGAQQLRLNQAVNALPDMLDKVDALASQWRGGKFPALNKANLALAKQGGYGSDVASVANQLEAQIADVTADLSNVYMGGNSPTDHALGLAGKSLKGEWDEKVLHDMVKLAKTNVTIRQNSIRNTGVAGASADNPYAPPAPAAAAPPVANGLISVTDPLGGVHQFSTQAAADAFKKAAGIK